MLLRFAVSLAGADFSYHADQVAEIEDAWAVNLISGGIAHKVGEPDGKQDLHATGDGAGIITGSEGLSAPRRKRSR